VKRRLAGANRPAPREQPAHTGPGVEVIAARVPVRAVAWKPCHRLIASRYPTVALYDAIADPADLEVVFAVEALTNARLRNELGQLQLVPSDERISGAGSTPIMAAFTHLNPEGSRFSDGSYGVYYAAQDLDTAIAEVSHHRALFMARTHEPEIDIDLRLITAPLEARLHDLRGLRRSAPQLYDALHYGAASPGPAFARRRQLGRGLPQPAPTRRPLRGRIPAEGAEAGTRGRAHRLALGWATHHALVREAGAAAAGVTDWQTRASRTTTMRGWRNTCQSSR
jgi:hypothetical protein